MSKSNKIPHRIMSLGAIMTFASYPSLGAAWAIGSIHLAFAAVAMCMIGMPVAMLGLYFVNMQD